MKNLPGFFCVLAAFALIAAPARAAVSITFPPGSGWDTATPEQIRQAVFNAVKENPDAAVDIVTAAIESVAKTGRFPAVGGADGKQTVDPDVVTFEDVSEQIGQAAIQANPALANQITQAVSNAVAKSAPVAAAESGGSGGGGDGGAGGGGGAPPPLPGGFGGGGGGGGGSIYSQ